MTPDYRDQHMRANACEGIGKELKIKCKFYVSSRDVRTVCPRLISRIIGGYNHDKTKTIITRVGQRSGPVGSPTYRGR
jgi:hypothetical protein